MADIEDLKQLVSAAVSAAEVKRNIRNIQTDIRERQQDLDRPLALAEQQIVNIAELPTLYTLLASKAS